MPERIEQTALIWKILSWFAIVPIAIIAQLSYHYKIKKELPKWKVYSIVGSAVFVGYMSYGIADWYNMNESLSRMFGCTSTLFSEHIILGLMVRGKDLADSFLNFVGRIVGKSKKE